MTVRGTTVAALPDECRLVLHDSDFIPQNHRVHGVSVLPGVTFLDMVWRVLRACDLDLGTAELRRIVFSEAVVTADGRGREIRLRFGDRTGHREVVGESRRLDGARPLGPWRENFRAQVCLDAAPVVEPPLQPASRRGEPAVGGRSLTMADMYAHTRSRHIVHGAAMSCTGTLRIASSELLAELTLARPDPAAEEWFHLHPAKLDAATIVAYAQTHERTVVAEPFIPMFIERFRAPRPLHGAFFVHVPHRETLGQSADLFDSDLLLYDELGRLAARFDRLTCKRIRRPDLIRRLLDEPEDVRTRGPGTDVGPAVGRP